MNMVKVVRLELTTRYWVLARDTRTLPICQYLLVTRQGLEPWTHALKGRCSTN